MPDPFDFKQGLVYDLSATTLDRKGTRPATAPDAAHRMFGLDCGSPGGVSPFCGFTHIWDLVYGEGSGVTPDGDIRHAAKVRLRINDSVFANGILYSVAFAGDIHYRLVLRISTEPDGSYQVTDTDLGFASGLLTEDDTLEPFHVEIVGKFAYVFRTGRDPFMFYVTVAGDGANVADFTLVVETNLGPGVAPTLTIPETSGFSAKAYGPTNILHPDMAAAVPILTAPTGDIPADARIVFAGLSDRATVSTDNINFRTNPYVTELVIPSTAYSGTSQAQSCTSITEIKMSDGTPLWAAPPFPDPSFSNDNSKSGGGTQAYAFPAPLGEYNGGMYDKALRDTAAKEPVGLGYGNEYVWAYQLLDSTTGRRSPLSSRVSATTPIQAQNAVYVTGISGNYTVVYPSFPFLYIIYDRTRFDTCILYRGIRTSGTTAEQAILFLDSVIELADYHIDAQPVDPDWKVAAYFAQLEDDVLVFQSTQSDTDVLLADMPQAGTAFYREGQMVLGDFSKIDSTGDVSTELVAGTGYVRWSSPYYSNSVEMFAPLDRYQLRKSGDEVRSLQEAGPNIMGLSRRGVILFRRETLRFKGFPCHDGMGLAGKLAATSISSEVIYLTSKGIMSLTADGSLKGLDVVNNIIIKDWKADLSTVQMVYDEFASVLFVYCPVQRQAVLFWLQTSAVSQLKDMPFTHLFQLELPEDPTQDYDPQTNPMQCRVAGIHQVDRFFNPGMGKLWRVWLPDWDKLSDTRQFLKGGGTHRFSLATLHTAGNFIETDLAIDDTWKIEGGFLYVLDGPDAGASAMVVARDFGNPSYLQLDASLPELPVGTRMGFSPVSVDWCGCQIFTQYFKQQGSLLTRISAVSGIACAFTNVLGDAATDTTNNDARYQAYVLRGTTDTEYTGRNYGFGVSDSGGKRLTILDISDLAAAGFVSSDMSTDGAGGVSGPVLCPGVKIYCPDLDYTLCEVVVYGSSDGSRRSVFP